MSDYRILVLRLHKELKILKGRWGAGHCHVRFRRIFRSCLVKLSLNFTHQWRGARRSLEVSRSFTRPHSITRHQELRKVPWTALITSVRGLVFATY